MTPPSYIFEIVLPCGCRMSTAHIAEVDAPDRRNILDAALMFTHWFKLRVPQHRCPSSETAT